MKLLLIGQSVVDHIYDKDKTFKKPGGIFYSALALKNLISTEDEIYLCSNLDEENYYLFENLYEKINTEYVGKVSNLPQVELKIYENEERQEKYNNITGSLNVVIDDLNRFDGILINMITGFDITLKQLQKIRKNFNGKIYFDVHTFTRGLDENMKREFRLIPDFKEWLKCIDIIHANQLEVKMLFPLESEEKIAGEILKYENKLLIVTKEDKGVRAYFNLDSEIASSYISAEKVDVKNKVGPGDVFGSSFFYYYLNNNDLIKTLKFANIAAGISATFTNLNEYENLKKDVAERFN